MGFISAAIVQLFRLVILFFFLFLGLFGFCFCGFGIAVVAVVVVVTHVVVVVIVVAALAVAARVAAVRVSVPFVRAPWLARPAFPAILTRPNNVLSVERANVALAGIAFTRRGVAAVTIELFACKGSSGGLQTVPLALERLACAWVRLE